MRVLLVAGALPPIRCGVGDYTIRLAETLAKRGNCVPAVLTCSAEAKNDYFQVIHGGQNSIRVRDVVGAIRRFRPDVVHIQYPTMRPISALVPVLAGWGFGLPVVQTWHEHYRECVQLSWTDLLCLDALAYVRDDLPEKLPGLVKWVLRGKLTAHIPNASSIRPVVLEDSRRDALRQRMAGDKAMVVFFGFAYRNKGVHALFDIADPAVHHLILICDLDSRNAYQRELLEHIEDTRWRGRATVTGFLPETEVAAILAAADAVVFPFPTGIGPWNTSVLAALDAGGLIIGTTQDVRQVGYDAERNMFLAACGDNAAMREALSKYCGRRRSAATMGDSWEKLAAAHEELYMRLI